MVYQMAKVASRAWIEAVRPIAARDGGQPLHLHFLNRSTLAGIAGVAAMTGPSQTIANRFLLREMLRKGETGSAAITRARRDGQTIRVVTGMRDPVSRSLSMLHFAADFYGDTSRPLDRFRGGDGAATAAVLREFWRALLAGEQPGDSFARLMVTLIGAYRNWFADELFNSLGVCLRADTVTGDPHRLHGDGVEVLLYRVEDMAPDAAGHQALLARASAFLGDALSALPRVNTADSRRSYARYQAAAAAFRLSAAELDAIYDAPSVKHFYSIGEVAAFKRRWLDQSEAGASS